MTTKCIEVTNPYDRRRKATIITNDKEICEQLAKDMFCEKKIKIILEDTKRTKPVYYKGCNSK